MISDERLSRVVAHALRHAPWVYELEVDEDGWAPVDQLLDALRRKGGGWGRVDRAALNRMVTTGNKRRYEVVGERIRALYGHSLPVMTTSTPSRPPTNLFHGTAPGSWEAIRAEGLRPMLRRYVHLSVDLSTATEVGRRKSTEPLVLLVRAAEAARCGVRFYVGNELVWLADEVPARFIEPHQTS